MTDLSSNETKPLTAYVIAGNSAAYGYYRGGDLGRGIQEYGSVHFADTFAYEYETTGGTGNIDGNGVNCVKGLNEDNPIVRANWAAGVPFWIDTVFGCVNYPNLASLEELLAFGDGFLIPDLLERKPALVVIDNVGYWSVARGKGYSLKSGVLQIIAAAQSIGAAVLLVTDYFSTGGTYPTFALSATYGPERLAEILAFNDWLRRLPDSHAGVHCFDAYAYAVHPGTGVTKSSANGQQYLYDNSTPSRAFAQACTADLAALLRTIAGQARRSHGLQLSAPSSRPVVLFQDVLGALTGTGITNRNVTTVASKPDMLGQVSPPACASGWGFTAGKWIRRDLVAGSVAAAGLCNTSHQFRVYSASASVNFYIGFGKYVVNFDYINNLLKLYNNPNVRPWGGGDFDASQLGSLIQSWALPSFTAGLTEHYTIDLERIDTSENCAMSVYSARLNAPLVVAGGSLRLPFDAAAAESTITLIAGTNSAAFTIGTWYSTGLKKNGNVLPLDDRWSSFSAVTTPGNGWSGNFPAELVNGAAFHYGFSTTHSANVTVASSAVARADGGNLWQWAITATAADAAACFEFNFSYALRKGRAYRLKVSYKMTGHATARPNFQLQIYRTFVTGGFLECCIGRDLDPTGNPPANHLTGAVFDDMPDFLTAYTPVWVETENSFCELWRIWIFVTFGHAGSSTLQIADLEVIDVTDEIVALGRL